MSQAGANSSSGGGGGSNIQTLTPDTGGVVSPVANNINVFGKTSTVNNNNGIQTANGGVGELDVRLTNRLQGTGTTVGATTADLVTFSLGATPGAFNFELKVIGFDAVTPSATGFTILGTMRTTGAAATLVGTPDETVVEDVAMISADVDMIASGNNLIIRSTGVAGLTIDWNVVALYVFVG